MLNPKAVIFDMDGLMLDTETISHKSFKAAAKHHDIPIHDDWLFEIIGMNAKGISAHLSEKLGSPLPDELLHTSMKFYKDYIDNDGIDLKSGLIDLFEYLQANGIRRAVATSTRTEMAHKKLKLTGIHHWFEHIVAGDQVENGKPAPDIYLKAAQQLGLKPKDCIALEDSNNGALAAYRADMAVFVVPDIKPPSLETKAFAHKVVPSLDHVITHLGTNA